MKMIMEAVILIISWHYNTMKMRNNSKSKHVVKQKKQTLKALKRSVNWKKQYC